MHLTVPSKNEIISAGMIPRSFLLSQYVISRARLFLTWWCLMAKRDWDFTVLNTLKYMWKRPCASQGLAISSLLTCCGLTERQDMDFLSADLITSAGSVPCFEGNCGAKEGLDLQRCFMLERALFHKRTRSLPAAECNGWCRSLSTSTFFF